MRIAAYWRREVATVSPLRLVDADRFHPSGDLDRAPSEKLKLQLQGSMSLALSVNNPSTGDVNPIAGIVLPIKRAEELLATLPGVVSARIVAGPSGAVDEIHLLTTDEVQPKSTVRNVESALLAHLGMRVSHKKISVATTTEPSMRRTGEQAAVPAAVVTPPAPMVAIEDLTTRRRLYFEDVEVRRSRSKGVACRVTLRKGDQTYVGEAEGVESERMRIELAARAALTAITMAEGDTRSLGLEGARQIDAFDRQFVFVGVSAKLGRENSLLTGSAQVKESPEQSAVLAVLNATNRFVEFIRP